MGLVVVKSLKLPTFELLKTNYLLRISIDFEIFCLFKGPTPTC